MSIYRCRKEDTICQFWFAESCQLKAGCLFKEGHPSEYCLCPRCGCADIKAYVPYGSTTGKFIAKCSNCNYSPEGEYDTEYEALEAGIKRR